MQIKNGALVLLYQVRRKPLFMKPRFKWLNVSYSVWFNRKYQSHRKLTAPSTDTLLQVNGRGSLLGPFLILGAAAI
jgi:hypothetical protein